MNYLVDYGFDNNYIETIKAVIPHDIEKLMNTNEQVVMTNLSYLKDLGVTNYQDVFVKYYDMFLLDPSTFKNIFDKYEPEDLIAKINKNINIIEIL